MGESGPTRVGRFDRRVARGAAQLAARTPWAHGVARAYTATVFVHFGGWLALGWWRAWRSGDPDRVRGMVAVTTGTTVAFATAQAVSLAVHRHRPFVPDERAPVLAHPADSSFPSDHATLAAVIATGLCLVDPPVGAVATVAAGALAADRVYLGVHYPSDVAAGAVLGAATAFVTRRAAAVGDRPN